MTVPTFPSLVGLGFPVDRKTLWSTARETAWNGTSAAFPNWSYPRYQFTVHFEFLGSGTVNGVVNTDWQTLSGFFDQLFGGAALFQINIPDDSVATNQAFGTGDGVTTKFQLVRTMGVATCPVYSIQTSVIKDNGVTKTPITDYTIDNFGVVTFVVAPVAGHALTWTGTYDWYCRFDDDTLDFSNIFPSIWSCPKLTFTTVKFGSPA